MNDSSWTWWAGRSEEFYTEGPFKTRKQAISEGQSAFCDDDVFAIICAQLPGLTFDAERLIDSQYFEADDLFDFDYSEPEWRAEPAARKEAVAALQGHLDTWVRSYGHLLAAPSMFANTKCFEMIEVVVGDD